MLAPLSWLKEYVDTTLSPKELGERLTEVGLSTEKITKVDDDIIFEFETTPNRPDLLSIIGIAREIAAIERKSIRYPKIKTNLKPSSHMSSGSTKSVLIKTDPEINPRFTGIIVDNIKVGKSPNWLKEKLLKIGQRPINNIVDITNYVMFELGNPIHAFDYEKIIGRTMDVERTKGGELFKSVDGISYHLPKDAVIIKDKENVIDLCGIKGGFKSRTSEGTKTIFIRVPVENAILIRRASQALGLRSDASSIFERGVNKGGTIEALSRCVNLILEIAGGKIASKLYDIKNEDFEPWKLKLRLSRLNQILGITIPEKKVIGILNSLNLLPVILNRQLAEKNHSNKNRSFASLSGAQDDIRERVIECTIPTYRNDLIIEENLIEEVARLYGYNNFPKTMPIGQMPIKQIPYAKDYKTEEKAKNFLKACGFSEIYTYSLINEKDLAEQRLNPQHVLRVDNPVSREFEYLRPTLKISLIKAFFQNKPNFTKKNLFELGKVYLGKNLDEAKEAYFLSGITNAKNFFEVKGILERLFEELGVKDDPSNLIEILNEGVFFEFNFSDILKRVNLQKKFIPLPKYPPIIEDLALLMHEKIKTIDIIEEIINHNSLIVDVSLLDQFEDSRTFHIVYQHKERNLTSEEVATIRSRILKALEEKFKAKLKE